MAGTRYHLFLNTSFLFLLCFYLATNLSLSSNSHSLIRSASPITNSQLFNDSQSDCTVLQDLKDPKTKCQFLKSQNNCKPEGYLDYLQLFYCNCGKSPLLGFTLLFLWLLVLFYLLGNTTATYFCSSLESLSKILKLSPTLAGVTLLSLGNGAPDVFSSIVSFMGVNSSDVGFNSILGGAIFVSGVVAGIVSISVSSRRIPIDKFGFVRDIVFFIFALISLLVILIVGRINLWEAIAFTSLYFVYVFVVCYEHFLRKTETVINFFDAASLLPCFYPSKPEEQREISRPLLGNPEKEEEPILKKKKFYEFDDQTATKRCFNICSKLLYVLELPLSLPRKLSIPVVCEQNWSKPYAVASVTFAPILLAALWNSQERITGYEAKMVAYIIGGSTGGILGILVFFTTEKQNPPTKFLFPWLLGGFLMSIVWTYIIADELVSLLVSIGNILGISPSILGLTVLAWGNSVGDLIANVTLALNGGPDGAQVAMSGCYAGPIFNILIGLGLSLVFSCWSQYPSPFVITADPSLFETLAFLVSGLLWALVVLPRRDMKLDRSLGLGLLAIYLCFLSLRLTQTFGFLHVQGHS